MAGFFGMRSNSDWETDQRPKNWREMILRLYPNGQAPLTAIQSMGKSEPTTDPEFNWWTKALPTQEGSITGIYTNVTLASAYASGGVTGTNLYVKVAEATAAHFRPGHVALLTYTSDLDVGVLAKVTQVVKNGASSYIAVRLLEADDNSSSYDLSDADTIKVANDINPEGGVTPDAISYTPTKYSSYTGITRTSLEMTRTAMKTRLRTGDQRKEAKREALELHGIGLEWRAIFSIAYEGTGDNGKPERLPWGIIPWLKTYNSSNIVDYTTDANYTGQTWLQGGDDWLLDIIELLYRYNDGNNGDYIMYAGSGVVKALERLAKAGLDITIGPAANVGYGIKVREWVTSFGSLFIKTHPLYSYTALLRNAAVICKPGNIVNRILDDTMFYGTPEGKDYVYTSSGRRIDGINEEFITEMGTEFHHPQTFMFAKNFGQNNVA